jgi:ribonuclease Z
MLDCGPGATYKMSQMGLSPTQVNTLLLSHHHTDHNVDFPCFSLLRFDMDNGDLPPLEVYGPAPTESFVERLVGKGGVFEPDVVSRQAHPAALHNYLQRGGSLPRPETKAIGHNLESGQVVERSTFRITAIQVPHLEPYLISLAYRIDTEEGSVLYLGDAGINETLLALAEGVDTFITGILGWNTRGGDEPDSHHNVSADIPDVIDVVRAGGIPRVVGIHGSPGTEQAAALLREGYEGKGFNGEVVCPEECTTLEL